MCAEMCVNNKYKSKLSSTNSETDPIWSSGSAFRRPLAFAGAQFISVGSGIEIIVLEHF